MTSAMNGAIMWILTDVMDMTHLLPIGIIPHHTMPNLDHIYAISEVIILNNDQHQRIISTNKRINSNIN